MEPLIFDIEKFALHDGPGIRTVVFLKGCPLHCLWCHNPESQSCEPEIFFVPEKCIDCGRCLSCCPRHCHTIENDVHRFERKHCIGCGKCAEDCVGNALKKVGVPMTIEQVMTEVLKDRIFYESSGGGLTISGGEPLLYPEWTKNLLTAAKRETIHTCLETCGFANFSIIAPLIPLVDLWLWDFKACAAKHAKLTGRTSEGIVENLLRLDAAGARTILRCPLIPAENDAMADLRELAALANRLRNLTRIDLEPYHPLGESKRLRLGRTAEYTAPFAAPGKVQQTMETLKLLLSCENKTKLTRA